MAAERRDRPGRSSRRCRRRAWLRLGLLGTALTLIGLIAGSGGRLPRLKLFPPVEGISEADVRLLDEIKRLGGTAHFMETAHPARR